MLGAWSKVVGHRSTGNVTETIAAKIDSGIQVGVSYQPHLSLAAAWDS